MIPFRAKIQKPRSGIRPRLFACCILALAMSFGIAEAQNHAVKSPADIAQDQQAELNRLIDGANAAQRSGNLSSIAAANQKLLAYGLHLMGELRVSEGAYAQAAALYRASMKLGPLPGIHSDLALADGMSGNEDEAVKQAKLALAEGPPDPHIYVTLA